MISPSKNAEAASRLIKNGLQCNKKTKPTTVKGNKNKAPKLKKKPYSNKVFYLDLKSSKESARLETALISLGGVIAVFLDRSVTHVVTDRLGLTNGVASPAASISPLPTASPCTSDRALLNRSRGGAMLERAALRYVASTYADPLQLANQWNIRILPIAALWRDILSLEAVREGKRKITVRSPKSEANFIKIESTFGTMTRRSYKNSITSEEDSAGASVTSKSSALCNGHGNRHSQEDLKVQCNGLSANHRSSKLLSPSGSDVLPLPSQRRSTRRASASWCGSTRELAQLSPTDSELGVTLRPKGTLWLPVALIGTTAEEHGNGVRPRKKKLSPEEKLLQDNKEYFKMEVLNTKLRSSGSLLNLAKDTSQPHIDKIILKKVKCRSTRNRWTKTKDVECIEESVDYEALITENKIMKVNGMAKKQKKTRRTELMKLCDEAESFMFGESSRQSAVSEDDRKEDASLDDSQWEESKQRKKRRSHAEAFIHDNIDYYKFETTGSRLRNQGSICDSESKWDEVKKEEESEEETRTAMFSFETVPCEEPWYEVYTRQNEGKEIHYPVISDPANQLFLLPYELPRPSYANRRDIGEYYAKRRKRLAQIIAQNHPRKSPRCHASTLAILSSLKKRKRKSSATDPEPSPRKAENILNISDDEVEELEIVDPEDTKESGRRRKKTEDRLAPKGHDPFVIIETPRESQPTVDVLDIVERFRYDNDLVDATMVAALPVNGRGSRRKRKCRKVNRTGWDKAKARRGRRPRRNTGIEAVNIVTSPRRSRSSVEEHPPPAPSPPRARKIKAPKNDLCRKLVFTNKKRAVTDYSWTTRKR